MVLSPFCRFAVRHHGLRAQSAVFQLAVSGKLSASLAAIYLFFNDGNGYGKTEPHDTMLPQRIMSVASMWYPWAA